MGDDFYLTLPSNAGNNPNSSSSFRVTLPRGIKLTGAWEAALVELIYPYSWYNVPAKPTVAIYIEAPVKFGDEFRSKLYICPLKAGHYSKIEDLIAAMIKTIPAEIRDKVILRYDSNANRVHIRLLKPVTAIEISDPLLYILGYNVSTFGYSYAKDNPGVAPHPPDMRAGLSIFYVYCDVVEQSVIGDKLASLLRSVAVSGKFGDIIHSSFDHPHYVPVLKKDFDSIEIAIKTDQNEPVALEYGKTLVKLHFRRNRSSLFS